MIKIKIIAMGRLTEASFNLASSEDIKRISKFFSLTVTEIKPVQISGNPGAKEIENALLSESSKIIAEIPPKAYVVAACVEGKQLSSEKFSSIIEEKSTYGYDTICFIIGSSHGLHDSVKKRSDLKLSFSEMTFPHELFRVLLLEQIYRAGEILNGGKYHK